MTAQIDVSVIIAAWRAGGFIDKAIASALASTGITVEVIAVDDASPDDTFNVLSRIASSDQRVTALRLEKNAGPSGARNRAIEVARGRYVAVLDADDVMAPGRLAELVALADKHDADIAVDNMLNVDEGGVRLADNPFLKSSEFATERTIDLATWIRCNNPMSGGDTLGYLKPVIRRAKLLESGIVYDTALRNSEDYYLIADLLADKAKMIYTPGTGYLYTRSSSSTSYRLKPDQTQAWLAAEARFIASHGAGLTADARAAQTVRQRALRNVDKLVAVTDALKARKLVKTGRLLASDLSGAAYTLGTLTKVAAGKALKRKFV
ncbi:MAG: glycosyltransferase family 2 protein [Burkholderiales bacterium]|nr:MAG: glycosyltransferase family 2 protein [Burkholderiales bacterium]